MRRPEAPRDVRSTPPRHRRRQPNRPTRADQVDHPRGEDAETTLSGDPQARIERLRLELRSRQAGITLPQEDLGDRDGLYRLATALLRAFALERIPLAFELLYELTSPILADIIAPRLVGVASFLSPEEVIAETYFLIYRKPESFRPRGVGAFRNWALTIAVNVIRQEIRARRRRVRREEIVTLRESRIEVSPAGDPVRMLLGREEARRAERDRAERLAAVRACFESLSPLTRRCVEMAILEAVPYREIGQRLGLSEGAVTMRVRRARLKARALLGEPTSTMAPSLRASRPRRKARRGA